MLADVTCLISEVTPSFTGKFSDIVVNKCKACYRHVPMTESNTSRHGFQYSLSPCSVACNEKCMLNDCNILRFYICITSRIIGITKITSRKY